MTTNEGAFAPVVWALKHAPQIRNAKGALDMAASLTLAHLALYADADGANAWPSVATLAERSGLTDETVRKALSRLAAHGLVTLSGTHDSGTVVYRLPLHKERPAGATNPVELARVRRRQADRERQVRRRERLRHGVGDRDHEAKPGPVTVSEPVSHGVPDRDVTVSQTVSHGVGRGGPSLDRPFDLPSDRPSSAPAGARTSPITSKSQDEQREAPSVVAESKEGKEGDRATAACVPSPALDAWWAAKGQEALGRLQLRNRDIYGTWRAETCTERLRAAYEGHSGFRGWVAGAGLTDLVQAPQLTLVEAS